MSGELKIIKCKFKDIIRDYKYSFPKLFGCINSVNTLTFHCYSFLRFILIKYFEEGKAPLNLNEKFIRRIYDMFTIRTTGGNRSSNESDISKTELKAIFDEFCKITGITEKELIKSCNISKIIDREIKCILTAYKNNITINFHKYLFQWVNEINNIPRLKKLSRDDYGRLTEAEKCDYKIKQSEITAERKILFKELAPVKKDLIENTLESDKKYHNFIKETRKKYFGFTAGNLLEDIKVEPYKYLNPMLNMNRELENKGNKLFQPIPLRTDISRKCVAFDTSAIKDLFGEVNNKLLNKTEVWNKYFDLRKTKLKGYSFNNLILTDGISVSISFISDSGKIKKENKTNIMTKESKEGKKRIKAMTAEELLKFNSDRTKNKQKKFDENKKLQKERKESFKKLPKDEQLNVILKMNEFNYIDKAIKNKGTNDYLSEQLRNEKLVYIDPGKRNPATMLGENGCRYNYTNSERIKETKRNKLTKLRQNKLNEILGNQGIKKLYEELSKTNSKTTYSKTFSEYLRRKYYFIKRFGLIERFEYSNYLNKLKWHSYINTKRHEDVTLNKINKIYGEDCSFIIGDWSTMNKIRGLPSPNMRIKRLLSRGEHKVFLIDEFNTSKLDHEEFQEMKHPIVSRKYKNDEGEIKEYSRELYSVFTCKMSNGNQKYINRDYNATLNMRTIVKSELSGKGRPEAFKRKINKGDRIDLSYKSIGLLNNSACAII
jgi:hypothetical protein